MNDGKHQTIDWALYCLHHCTFSHKYNCQKHCLNEFCPIQKQKSSLNQMDNSENYNEEEAKPAFENRKHEPISWALDCILKCPHPGPIFLKNADHCLRSCLSKFCKWKLKSQK